MFLIYGLLLAVFTLKCGVFTSIIHLSPSQVNVVENASVELTCSKENSRLSESLWTNSQIKDQIANLYYYNGQCVMTRFLRNNDLFEGRCNSDGTFSVLLKRVDRTQHSAVWKCGEVVYFSNTVSILVSVPVTSVDIYSSNETYMKENHSQALRCNPSACRPQPTIRWSLLSPIDLAEYNVTQHSIQIINENEDGLTTSESLLTLLPNRSVNGWSVICKAWNNNQYDDILSKNITLNVSFPPDGPPVITDALNGSKFQIAEHEAAHLSCTVSGGNPLAHIVWFCSSGIISEVRESNTVTSSITWTALRNQQNTSCICVAEHAFGNVNTSVTVDILYKASVLQFYIGEKTTEKDTFTVSVNDTITFSCITDSKPPPNVTISHNGRILHVSVSKNSLEFKREYIQCSDFGMYVCSAMNVYNNGFTSTRNLTLNVICSPRPNPFVELIENVRSPLHTSATLWFSALAYPEPGASGFTWYYLNGTERIILTNTHSIVISSLSSHSFLNIRKITQSEYGNYCLRIKNPIGVYEQKFSLKPFRSTTCPNTVANSSSTIAFIAVGFGTSIATTIFVVSGLFFYRFMRRKPKYQQNVQSDYSRHMKEDAPNKKDNSTLTEYEKMSMKTVDLSQSTVTVQNIESGNASTQHYDVLYKSRKETGAYSQLSALKNQREISRETIEVASIDNNETQHTIQDYINIQI